MSPGVRGSAGMSRANQVITGSIGWPTNVFSSSAMPTIAFRSGRSSSRAIVQPFRPIGASDRRFGRKHVGLDRERLFGPRPRFGWMTSDYHRLA